MRLMVSTLKVENVLKPPQKPTTQKMREAGEINCLWSAKPMKKPTAKQAPTLAANVPQGKWCWCNVLIHFPRTNRVTLPNPPPKKTNSSWRICVMNLLPLVVKSFQFGRALLLSRFEYQSRAAREWARPPQSLFCLAWNLVCREASNAWLPKRLAA